MNIEDEFLKEIIPDKQRSTRKKSKNSKKKGNRGELDCVNILKKRFPGKIFTRTMGSGNYTGGKNAYHAETLNEDQILLSHQETQDELLKLKCPSIGPLRMFDREEHSPPKQSDFDGDALNPY